MASKTLTISEDAYHRLVRLRRQGESFSQVIERLTGKEDLKRFVGAISPAFAEELRGATADFRSRFDREARRRTS